MSDPAKMVSRLLEEKNELEQKLIEITRSLDEAQRLTKIGSFNMELSTQNVECSKEMLRIWGYDPQKGNITYKQVYERLHPEDAARIDSAIKSAIENHETYDEVFRIVLPDGHQKYIHGIGLATRDGNGNPISFYGTGQDITEAKQIQETIRKSEQQFKALFMESPVSIIVHDKDTGEIIDANPIAIASYGFTTLKELQNTDIWLDPPYSLADAQKWIRKSLNDGPQDFEWLCRKKSGELFWEKVYLIPVEINGIQRILAESIDITNRKKAEDALKQSVTLHRTLIESIPDLVWLKDPDGVYLSCNPTFESFFGAGEEEIVGKTDYDFVDKELAEFFRDHDRKAMEADAPSMNEEWLTFADTGYRGLFETIKKPMKNADGDLIGVLGIARDISERKRIQNEIEAIANEQSWLLSSMINAFVIFHSVFDDRGKFISYRFEYINQAYEDITGVTLEEVRGKTVHEVWPETEDSWIQNYGHVAVTGESLTFEMFHQPTDKLYYCRVYRPWDTPEKFCVVFEDITQRKIAEKKFMKAEEERNKYQEQLYQAQKMESIGRLAGGIAHDFNNLLTGILGYVDMIMDNLEPGDPVKEDVKEIRSAGERAAELTAQLLAFSRKQVISPKVIRPNEVIENSINLLMRLIGEDINFQFQPGKRIGRIKIDPSQLDQILVNLTLNARDAMPDGGKLDIETQNVELEEHVFMEETGVTGEFIRISVTDSGEGIPKDILVNIFEPFFTTKEQGKGTGLGLATVYGIVKQNGGFIDVQSEINKGATFSIYFPRVFEQVDSLAQTRLDEDMIGSETIMLVEDEDVVRRLARRVLESRGYNIIEASNGGEAFVLFEQNPRNIDLLLTDVIMPNMSGKQLFDRLLKIKPDLKALFMSGYNDDVVAHHGVLEKNTYFISKPYHPKDLLKKVRQLLEKKAASHGNC